MKYNIAIVGATGIVGLELLKILDERRFPVRKLRLFASAGRSIKVKGKRLRVNKITDGSFAGIDIAFFAVDGAISRKWTPVAVKSGAVVIDKSSAFRMDKNVPLVIPEINADAIKPYHRIIASPNCTTTPLAMVLKPLNDYAKVKRVVVSTYQAVSGAGLQAVREMEQQTKHFITRSTLHALRSTHPYAFNAIPQIDSFCDDDYTGEEVKMINETRKILDDYYIMITPTCVRVPVYCGHSESVNIETARPITVAAVRKLLGRATGIKVIDNPAQGLYPMPIEVAGEDDVFVGRIRRDQSVRNGVNLWLVSDNLRKGAALNAVQIAEYLIGKWKDER
ncbi:MAG: aspartate-semialdehyde dehydrogenase [Planctomycetota bacterium]